jgi:hypothetical protein
MINKLPVIAEAFHSYFSYLRIMPGVNKNIKNDVRYELPFVARSFTCSLPILSKKLNYFPTCKDFHNRPRPL